jgi:hypothetical protein
MADELKISQLAVRAAVDLLDSDYVHLYLAPAATYAFFGRMGMVGLWDTPLDQDDIDYLYNAGAGRLYGEL